MLSKEDCLQLIKSNYYHPQLFLEYCLEHGKDLELSKQFLSILSNNFLNNSLYRILMNDVLEYYLRKFEFIVISETKTNKILLIY